MEFECLQTFFILPFPFASRRSYSHLSPKKTTFSAPLTTPLSPPKQAVEVASSFMCASGNFDKSTSLEMSEGGLGEGVVSHSPDKVHVLQGNCAFMNFLNPGEGAAEGAAEGASLGAPLGTADGESLGLALGAALGAAEGAAEGASRAAAGKFDMCIGCRDCWVGLERITPPVDKVNSLTMIIETRKIMVRFVRESICGKRKKEASSSSARYGTMCEKLLGLGLGLGLGLIHYVTCIANCMFFLILYF